MKIGFTKIALISMTFFGVFSGVTDAKAETGACNVYEYPQFYVSYPSYLKLTGDSQSARDACVAAIYASTLNRSADSGGLSYYSSRLASYGLTYNKPSAIRSEIASSPEATALINSVYRYYLGRNADPSGLAYWRSVLATYGQGINAVISGVSNSAEAQRYRGY